MFFSVYMSCFHSCNTHTPPFQSHIFIALRFLRKRTLTVCKDYEQIGFVHCAINSISHCRCIYCRFLPAEEQNKISPEFSLWPHCLHPFPTLLFFLAFRSAGEEPSINSAALSFISAPPLNGMSVVVMVRTGKLPDLSNRLQLCALLLLPQHVQPWQC